MGFEPTIFGVTGRYVRPLHHGATVYVADCSKFHSGLSRQWHIRAGDPALESVSGMAERSCVDNRMAERLEFVSVHW